MPRLCAPKYRGKAQQEPLIFGRFVAFYARGVKFLTLGVCKLHANKGGDEVLDVVDPVIGRK